MTFPTTAAPTASIEGANTTTHTVNIPAHNTNDIILMLFGADGFPLSQGQQVLTISALNGAAWTLFNSGAGIGSQGQTIVTPASCFAWVRATSDQGSPTTVNVVTERSENSATHVYVASGAHTTTDPAFAFNEGTGGTINYNPPTLNPADWDVEDTLWLFFTTADSNTGTTTFDTFPAGWTVATEYGASDVKLLSGYQTNAVASNMPGTGNLDSAEQTISFTIAIRPAAGGGTPSVTPNSLISDVEISQPVIVQQHIVNPDNLEVSVDISQPTVSIQPQHLPPVADLHIGLWQNELAQTTNLFESINEQPVPTDSDYIFGVDNQDTDVYVTRVLAGDISNVDTGHKVVVRGRKSSDNTVDLLVEWRTGYTNEASPGTVIHSDTITLSLIDTTYEVAVPEVNAASIPDIDYTSGIVIRVVQQKL